MLTYTEYKKRCRVHYFKNLYSYKSWDSVTWITFISNMKAMGKTLPIRNDLIDTIGDEPFTLTDVEAIMDSDLYTMRILRRLSGIFLVRIHISDKLVDGYIKPLTKFTIIGEAWQVTYAKAILNLIQGAYIGFKANKAFLATLKGAKNDHDAETMGRNLTKTMLNILDRWPSFRPKNTNHPHALTPTKGIRKYQGYELRMFLFIIGKYKFTYDRPAHNPTAWEKMPNTAPWQYISDMRTNTRKYRSLLAPEVLRKNNIIWPGRV